MSPRAMIDYRSLLIRYIAHVGDCEGIVFLEDHWRQGYMDTYMGPPMGHSLFTPEEWQELKELNREGEKLMLDRQR